MVQHMLTTKDNPHSPFDDYPGWMAFDQRNGYYTAELLARYLVTSEELSDADQTVAVESAIDEILDSDLLQIYTKVSKGRDS